MNKSESIGALAKALSKAQTLIEGAVKDKTNPHFRSKYADLGNVVDAIRPAISGCGLSFAQIVIDIENRAAIETIILHESGEWLSCGVVSVPVSKADAQGFGSAMTYARRYGLSAAFGVAPEDDDGNAASHAKPSTARPAPVETDHTPGFNETKWLNDFDRYHDVNELRKATGKCKAEAVAAKAAASWKRLQSYATAVADIIKAANPEALDLVVDSIRDSGVDPSLADRLVAVAAGRFQQEAA